ncbi:MAG: ResB protein required for cytochrome C biosynthesis [Verrucomicrobiota bacterium]
MANRIFNFLSSLKLTVVCLAFGIVLVFVGTLAQVKLGLYAAQEQYFRHFFVYWSPTGADWKIPVLPGGYLLGSVLLVNLFAAHYKRFELTRKKAGIFMVHAGIVLLLLGQLFTDLLSEESAMLLRVGETKNYSEDFQHNELVLIDKSKPDSDVVHAVPEELLAQKGAIQDAKLPFTLTVKDYWPNSDLTTSTNPPPKAVKAGATEGFGVAAHVLPLPKTTTMEDRNLPSAVVEVHGPKGSLGTWLVSTLTTTKQKFTADGKEYEIGMRFKRHYTDHRITLLECTHEIYRGTEVPKNFSSRILLENPRKNEKREVLIYMNNPLRYAGLTYFQYQMGKGGPDGKAEHSTFQVVRNPSWLTPYLACVIVGLGLIVQFMIHLVGFAKRSAGGGRGQPQKEIRKAAKGRKAEPEVAAVAATALPAQARRNV